MDIGKGHWVFALLFFIAFIVLMIWAYRKDKKISFLHYKGAYKMIILIVSILALLMLFVRFFKK